MRDIFLSVYSFLFHEPILDSTLYVVDLSPDSPLIYESFLVFFVFPSPLNFQRVLVRYLSSVLSWLYWSYDSGGRIPQRCPSFHVRGTWHQCDLLLVILTSITRIRGHQPSCSTVNYHSSLPEHYSVEEQSYSLQDRRIKLELLQSEYQRVYGYMLKSPQKDSKFKGKILWDYANLALKILPLI